MAALEQKLAGIFAENFVRYGELGASLSIWRNGREMVHIADGWRDREKTEPWTADTAVLVYSATKGPAAGCVLHALESASISLNAPVAQIWPEFAHAGKESITFRDVLAHRAGLAALDAGVSASDYEGVIHAIEEQRPLWPPGDGHGYHPRTIGYILDEIVRRVTKQTLGEHWRNTFAEPLGLDFWIGAPFERVNEIAPVFAARTAPAQDDFSRAYGQADSLTNRAFNSPRGWNSASAMNSPEVRMTALPAFGGIGTAQALAKFYAVLANGGELEGRRFLSPAAISAASNIVSNGFDRILQMPTAFSTGFMQDPVDATGSKLRRIFGPSLRAFGQPGAGGSIAFADPENGIGFAYVMNQMEPGVLPNAKSLRIVEALYEELE